jgi:hypothetical protein
VIEVTGAPGWRVHVNGIDVESVRVVDTHAEAVAESVAWEGARDAYRGRILRLTAERDAAIRERDALRASSITQSLTADRFASAVQEADKLRARVEELEAASNSSAILTSSQAASEWRILKVGEIVEAGDEMTDDLFMPWRDASPFIGEEVASGPLGFRRRIPAQAASGNSSAQPYGSQAASGGGEGEPDYYVYKNEVGMILYTSPKLVNDGWGGCTVEPVYKSPPQPRGWLTEQEIDAVADAADTLSLRGCGSERRARILRELLARSSPPEVVHPDCQFDQFSGCSAVHAWNICAADFRKALAAAGVLVKEVGCE